MSSSDLSSLSSVPSTDDELTSPPSITEAGTPEQDGIHPAHKRTTPTRPKRPASPPHEYVLADNPDIAFIVMFRSRFSDAFPKNVPHLGPQDIERGIVESAAGEQVEHLLCALLGLVLKRKKYVERGHYGRALEEAIQTQKSQWPSAWNGINPLSGGRSFQSMSPIQRLTLLRTLILWSLNTSEIVTNIMKESYKQTRHNDDLNQPLSVQPWGRDMDKRRYWLIEGQEDTHFRLYRENNPYLKHNTWWSVAGTIEELKAVAAKLNDEGSQAGKRLSDRIGAATPRFETSEEKRKRREYRQSRRTQFVRPEPGFSLYEGRTRGKRMKYTFSDEEAELSDSRSVRRSARSTPGANNAATVTASGRQVKSRFVGAYGEAPLIGQNTSRASPATAEYEESDVPEELQGARSRLRGHSGLRQEIGRRSNNVDRASDYNSADDTEVDGKATPSEGDWHGEEDEEEEPDSPSDATEDDDLVDVQSNFHRPRRSLLIKLRYKKDGLAIPPTAINNDYKEPNALNGTDIAASEPPQSIEGKPKLSSPSAPSQSIANITGMPNLNPPPPQSQQKSLSHPEAFQNGDAVPQSQPGQSPFSQPPLNNAYRTRPQGPADYGQGQTFGTHASVVSVPQSQLEHSPCQPPLTNAYRTSPQDPTDHGQSQTFGTHSSVVSPTKPSLLPPQTNGWR